ncbi:MAG: YdcF family protein [Bacteroidota bacterium]|nr:YdcF family protein [Bacteroidota bacterium]
MLDQFASRWDIAPLTLRARPYSCVIVLGGFTGEDANGDGFFNVDADRFIQGLKLVITGKASHILITSGNGNLIHDKFAEADWVKTQLTEFKMPDSSVLIEDKSRNTLENAAFSKTVIEQRHLAPPYLLVTSAFHMRRSLGIFRKAKLDVTPYPSNYIAGNGKTSPDSFIPNADALARWNTYIKEVVGTLVNYLK